MVRSLDKPDRGDNLVEIHATSKVMMKPEGWLKPEKKDVGPCDLSVMRYQTPLLHAQSLGLFADSEEEVDEAHHRLDVMEEEYRKDVLPCMPRWVLDYVTEFRWLNLCEVECLGKVEECESNPNLEQITFRFTPATGSAYVVTFKSVWVNRRIVLPDEIIEKPALFLYDEFSCDVVSVGNEEISYHFFCSDGKEYSMEGVYGIDWKEVHEPAVPVVKKESTGKRHKGSGNGKKLFSCIFKLETFDYVLQIKSKDWTTVWDDFKKEFDSTDELRVEGSVSRRWSKGLTRFHVEVRNVFTGAFYIDDVEHTVTIVNTKRGREPVGEEG